MAQNNVRQRHIGWERFDAGRAINPRRTLQFQSEVMSRIEIDVDWLGLASIALALYRFDNISEP
jgi:hypothetical protein